jgi:hypothetical protein
MINNNCPADVNFLFFNSLPAPMNLKQIIIFKINKLTKNRRINIGTVQLNAGPI